MRPLRALYETSTLPSLNVDRNPKSEMAISRQFSMKIWNRIDESLSLFKAFQTLSPRESREHQPQGLHDRRGGMAGKLNDPKAKKTP